MVRIRPPSIAVWCTAVLAAWLTGCTDCPDAPDIAGDLSAHEGDLLQIWSSFPAEVCVRGVHTQEDIQGRGFEAAGRFNPLNQRITLMQGLEERTGQTVEEVFRHEVCHAANPSFEVRGDVPLRTDLYDQRGRNASEEAARYCEAGQEALDWLSLAQRVCGDDRAFPVDELVAPVVQEASWPRVRRMRAPVEVREVGFTKPGPASLAGFVPLWVDEAQRHIRVVRVLEPDGVRLEEAELMEVDLATWEVSRPDDGNGLALIGQVWRTAGIDFRTWRSPVQVHETTGEAAGVIAVDRHAAFRVGEVDLLMCAAPDGFVAWFPEHGTLVALGDEMLRLHRYAD